jgi:hypothetical protein
VGFGGVQVDYVAVANRARALLLRAVRRYKSGENCDFIRKRFEYFDAFGDTANTDSFQLAILWASVGNSMAAMFWLLYHLLSAPAALQQVRREAAAVCPSCSSGAVSVDQEQLNRLVYLDACITETLRLCSGSLIMRHVREPCELTFASGA